MIGRGDGRARNGLPRNPKYPFGDALKIIQVEWTCGYKNAGWKRKKNSTFLPYEEAKKVVNALGLKNLVDWERWSRTENA